MWNLSVLDPVFHHAGRCRIHSDVPRLLHLQRVVGNPPASAHPLDILSHQGNSSSSVERGRGRPALRQRAQRARRERERAQEGEMIGDRLRSLLLYRLRSIV